MTCLSADYHPTSDPLCMPTILTVKAVAELLKNRTRIGVFSPHINHCGGAEWVAVKIVNSLKKENYETILLTNKLVDQSKFLELFGSKVNIDSQIVFPFEIAAGNIPPIYSDFIRTLLAKTKCDILIDASSCASLPGVDISYIHFPFLGHFPQPKTSTDYARRFRNLYYLPYSTYEKRQIKNQHLTLLANSKYTQNKIKELTGAESILLYPPISDRFFSDQNSEERNDTVISVGRISQEKRYHLIPEIAKLTKDNINFLIIGIAQSQAELIKIKELARTNNVEDRVRILTNVPSNTLIQLLRTSKVFLHTASEEHFGVSIVEAMASGCVTVVHDSGGAKEFVPSQFRYNTVEEAAELIEKAVTNWNPSAASEFTSRAKDFSEVNFAKKLSLIVKSKKRSE
jgi:alpha-1,2-mannosyltransferase